MDLSYSKQDKAFRKQVRAWMKKKRSPKRTKRSARWRPTIHAASNAQKPGSAACIRPAMWPGAGPRSTAARGDSDVMRQTIVNEELILARGAGPDRRLGPDHASVRPCCSAATEQQKNSAICPPC